MPDHTGRSRLGIAVQGAGGAVVRNRIKRRIREAFFRCGPRRGHEVVIRATREAATADFQLLVSNMEQGLEEVGAR
jgi:ribonuclease P protein component